LNDELISFHIHFSFPSVEYCFYNDEGIIAIHPNIGK